MPPYSEIFNQEGGFDAIQTFTHHFGGVNVYVPSLRTIFIKYIENEIRSEFNGFNYGQLAKKYDFTERHIRRIIQEKL